MTLQELHIEDRAEQKYAAVCPQCSETRNKPNTKSLMVYKDEDGTRYECLHPTCPWFGNRQFIKGSSISGDDSISKIEFQIPIPPEVGFLPIQGDNNISYTYKNTDGQVLFYIHRVDGPEGKTFFPLAFTKDNQWVKKRPTIKALYGAHLLPENKPYVIVVEGEKAADAGNKIFTEATVVTWAGGAQGINSGDWELLRDRKIILWPDNDEPGRQAMRKIAGFLSGQVLIVDPTSLPPKADLGDNLTKDQIKEVWDTQVPIDTRPAVDGLHSKDEIKRRLMKVKKGETFGWSNMNSLRLPSSGQVIIEGRTGHGKTTAMVNILAMKIKQQKAPLLFYSFEQPVEEILIKLTMVLDGRILDTDIQTNTERYWEECAAGTNEVYNDLLDMYGSTLFIMDDYITSDKLINSLTSTRLHGSIIFIDYAQYVPHLNNSQSRYLAIKAMVEKLQNVAKKQNMLIFTGSQLTIGETPDRDSPRECWDINFSADLVIRIWNKQAAETRGAQWKEAEELPGNLLLKVMKNRGGMSGQMFCFDLENGGRMTDIKSYGGQF